jgi:glycosyltransferase involved in cell wall biosynthesis
MACGIPLVATRVSGHRETVINGKTGILVDFNPEEIASALKRILIESAVARRLSHEGVRHVRRQWTWKISTQALEVLLQKYAEL